MTENTVKYRLRGKKSRFLGSFARGRLMGGARKILESHTKITA